MNLGELLLYIHIMDFLGYFFSACQEKCARTDERPPVPESTEDRPEEAKQEEVVTTLEESIDKMFPVQASNEDTPCKYLIATYKYLCVECTFNYN